MIPTLEAMMGNGSNPIGYRLRRGRNTYEIVCTFSGGIAGLRRYDGNKLDYSRMIEVRPRDYEKYTVVNRI